MSGGRPEAERSDAAAGEVAARSHAGEPIEVSRTKRAFLAHMRHELRTPLNAILSYGEMLLEDAARLGQEASLPELRKIHAAGNQLLSRVDGLLNPESAQDGTSEAELERFGANVRHELRTPLNAIIGYSELLLEDAADTEERALVPELEKIRAAARQLLALLEDIVRFSKIETAGLEVEVEHPEISTLIRDVVTTIRPLEEPGETAETESGSLLVVDDNEINRDLLSRRIEREGCDVTEAADGRRALELLASGTFDLVLLDIMMPGLNGYQVLQHMKADERLRHIPVIMISALDEIDSVVRCIEMGAEDYLQKPFNPVLLRARIRACLEKKRLRDREVLHLRRIEEERKRADDLLHVILPDAIVAELKATNKVKPRLFNNVAVLFCDVVEFTPFCEQREPEEIVSHLQELIEVCEQLTLEFEMQKIKTIGDAFMATAGLLKPVEHPVLNCVRCGLEMISVARDLSAQWSVRVGIHVGPVMAGVVGHRQYLFDLWGDTVNTAARVESHGANNSVNVSDVAWKQVANYCHGESLGRVLVKGKGEMELFRVDGLGAAVPVSVTMPEGEK